MDKRQLEERLGNRPQLKLPNPIQVAKDMETFYFIAEARAFAEGTCSARYDARQAERRMWEARTEAAKYKWDHSLIGRLINYFKRG